MTPQQQRFVAMLPCTIGDISAATGVPVGTVGNALAHLSRTGRVERIGTILSGSNREIAVWGVVNAKSVIAHDSPWHNAWHERK